MSRRIDFANQGTKQIFQHENGHLKFSSYQAPIKKSYSLRKVQTSYPTHRPEIHQLPFQIYPQRTKTEVSRQQLVERLLDNRREKAESLRAQKIKKQQNKIESCTFIPAINAESKRLADKEGKDQKEAFQRLYEEGLSKMKILHECTTSTAIADKENCTFHPNIGDKTKNKADLAPIYDRLYEILAQKRQSMRLLQQKVKQQQVKDRPQVSHKSKEMVQKKASFKKNVLQRLFDHMKDKNNKLERLVQKRQEEITKQCTFQPTVGPSHETSTNGNFLQRQHKEAIKLQQKMRYLQQNQKLTFVPQINKLSSLLVEGEREGQSQTQRLQRLHAQPYAQRQLELQRIQEEIYRQCTFQPEINMISRALQGEPHSHKCNCHPQEENYCFKPQINQKSRMMAEKPKPNKQYTVSPVERARKELDYKEMKQCTFKPKTLGNSYKSANQKISLENIRGANSYKARVQKVKAKRKQDQDLKSQLFELEKRYQQRKNTNPQPFNLSKRETKIVKLKQQAQQQFKKFHPFKPEILSKFR